MKEQIYSYLVQFFFRNCEVPFRYIFSLREVKKIMSVLISVSHIG